MKYIFIFLVKLYQKFISPLKPPCCRFEPSCSAYAIEALNKRGAFIGLGLAIWRVLRCSPMSKGGYDPVPEKKKRSRSSKATKDRLFLSDKANGRK